MHIFRSIQMYLPGNLDVQERVCCTRNLYSRNWMNISGGACRATIEIWSQAQDKGRNERGITGAYGGDIRGRLIDNPGEIMNHTTLANTINNATPSQEPPLI